MKRLFFALVLLVGSIGQAEVLSEVEMTELENLQVRDAFLDPVDLTYVEFKPKFKKDKLEYYLVYAEAAVKVVLNARNPGGIPFFWTPWKAAKNSMADIMTAFCHLKNGSKIKKDKFEKKSLESKKATYLRPQGRPAKILSYPSWDYTLNMKFRCTQ